jgi:hypothetical protein
VPLDCSEARLIIRPAECVRDIQAGGAELTVQLGGFRNFALNLYDSELLRPFCIAAARLNLSDCLCVDFLLRHSVSPPAL